MKALKIAGGVSLPLEVITQTIAILAKRRAGKSYTMRKLVEELLANGQQVVLVDPKGDQWGIRSSADGKRAGYPIVILGGEHGDAPLESTAGEVVAKLVVEERVSVLLDLSFFRKHEVATFMAAFLENLYRLKAQEQYRTPMMLVIDEADAVAPQKPQRGEERMLGAAEDIVRRGGQRGIGCALITQRSAVLNKNVLTQAQMLVVLRTIAPQDLAAMKAWIEVHGTLEEGKQLMDSLPSLPIGDAWFWSPGWPTNEGIFTRAHVLPITTFDSGATPKPGEKKIVPKNLADVDLEALKKQMAATLEKAKSEDPKALKKRIAELERQVRLAYEGPPIQHVVSDPLITQRAVEKAVEARDAEWRPKLEAANSEIARLGKIVSAAQRLFGDQIEVRRAPVPVEAPPFVKVKPDYFKGARLKVNVKVEREPGENLSTPEQRIVNAIAWLNVIGISHPSKIQAGFIAKYRVGKKVGGTFGNLLGTLRARGLIDYPSPGTVMLTEAGIALAQVPNIEPTEQGLHRAVYAQLSAPEARVLKVAIDAAPDELTKQVVAERSGYQIAERVGGTFGNLLGKLRTLGLIDYPRPGMVRAADLLFISH